MRFKFAVVFGVLLLAGIVRAEETVVLKDQNDRVSYSLGVNVGNNLKSMPPSVTLNVDVLVKGIRDQLSGGPLLMSEQEVRDTFLALQKELMAKQEEKMKEIGEMNKKEGEAFLAENKKKEGIVTLPSGLQYKVLKAGEGERPHDTDTVTVHYTASFINGSEFDSSYRRGQPATLPVNGEIIPGWKEALKLMQKGAKWKLFIPSNLAYGERGAGNQAVGNVIGPNVTLVFDVEVLSIQKKN